MLLLQQGGSINPPYRLGIPPGDSHDCSKGELHSLMSGRLEYELIQRSPPPWLPPAPPPLPSPKACSPLLQTVRMEGDSGEGESGPRGMQASNSRASAEMLIEGGVPLRGHSIGIAG